MVTFLTVLKSAERLDHRTGHALYKPVHVYALRKQLDRFYKKLFKFACLTDMELDNTKVESIKLKHNWPGWWSKMELFRDDLISQNEKDIFFYFDLDTLLVNDISIFVDYPHKFTTIDDSVIPLVNKRRIGTGVMAWSGDQSDIYKTFLSDTKKYMDKHGDQGVIEKLRPNFKTFNEIARGCIDYLYELRGDKNILPTNAKIIYSRYIPKFWDLSHPWVDKSLYKE